MIFKGDYGSKKHVFWLFVLTCNHLLTWVIQNTSHIILGFDIIIINSDKHIAV